jgi:hypothetical protein
MIKIARGSESTTSVRIPDSGGKAMVVFPGSDMGAADGIRINGFLDLCRLLWCPKKNRPWKKAFRYVALNRLASGF